MKALPKQTEIILSNLSKSFGDVTVIPELSATLNAGEFTVILGPSGCGKSTLLNLLAGLEQVSAGQIFFGDSEVQSLPAKDRGCAMVFQNYALYPHMSVADNIGYSLKISGIRKADRRTRIEAVSKVVGLVGLLNRRPSALSGGQRQRVAIARAIVREPRVLLFDEPLSNLDAQLRHEMRLELAELHKRIGSTSVFVTHDQVEAMTLADRILILNEGRIEQFDTPNEVYVNPATRFVAGFVGSPPMNLIPVTADGQHCHLSDGTLLASTSEIGEFELGVRAEDIQVGQDGIELSVQYAENLGSHTIVVGRLPDGHICRVSLPGNAGFSECETLSVRFPEEKIRFFDLKTNKLVQRKGR